MSDYDIRLDDKFGSLTLIDLLDLEDRETIVLEPHHGYTVPRGVAHRTRAPVRTAILMVEAAGVQPTGD